MTTSVSLPDSVVQPRRAAWRVAFAVLGVVLIALAVSTGWFYFAARSALPQLDGTLHVPGLFARVTVIRDAHGVPTIEASSLQDLFFAQGYVAAQDRLWQMDTLRRFAAGDLAEILGEDLLGHDKEQRILGMRQAARKTLEVSSATARFHLESYAKGVNAYIASRQNRLPLEFRLLRYKPRPWTPEDSMLIASQMVKDLNHGSFEQALTREKILSKLGPDLTEDLYVNSSAYDLPPTAVHPEIERFRDDREIDFGGEKSIRHVTTAMPLVPTANSDDPPVVGSNNWVVAGNHTVSGKPLLSNDMHLGHQMPNLWYEAHLLCGSFDVAGVTLPGMPYVIVGHNQRIAWGFTNINPTVEDVYVETFNDQGQYLTPGGWKQPEHRSEIIRIKGRPDATIDVALTRHGPLISELVPGEKRKLALRWTLYDGIRIPFFDLDSAHNWGEFRQALSEFDAPGQNTVYADLDGNIGYQATGKVPIRATGDGSLPEAGSDDDHEWTRYIPFDSLPRIYNPPAGIIATANSRITPSIYPYSISTGWEAPWRSARIYRVLRSGRRFSAADMLTLQLDIYSQLDVHAAEQFVRAIDHAKNPSAKARQAADLLRVWDGRMTADSAAAAIEFQSRAELVRLLLEPRLGPAPEDPDKGFSWKSYHWGMQSVWLENVIYQRPQRWLPSAYPNYDELLTAAVEAALNKAGSPSDPAGWRWGPSHPVEIQHPLFGRIPILRRWSGPGLQPQSGSGFSVKAGTRTHGPSERLTVDFGNFDRSTLNLVTGEAGNLLSPYYMDQWKAWYEGFTFTLPFSKQAVERQAQHRLALDPG